jgi:predicted DNA-binding transcriptional regulator AlpA
VTERILSVLDVCRKVSLGKSRLYEMIGAGDFVSPIQISKGRVGFCESAVDEWIRSRPIVNLRKPGTPKTPEPQRDIAA